MYIKVRMPRTTRKTAATDAAAPVEEPAAAPRVAGKKRAAVRPKSAPAPPPEESGAPVPTVASILQDLQTSLDALKKMLETA